MCASPLSLLRSGPPPPRVALLPDALFFTRVLPISAGAGAAEAATQAELALEALSPFPLAQLYYGWFWRPGAENAFVFAAYRRRFTAEQTAEWGDAELVLPVSAALAGATVEPSTTVLTTSGEGLTALHWEKPQAPARILFRPLPPEPTDEDRARARDELVRAVGGSRKVIELDAPVTSDAGSNDREVVFRAGEVEARFPAPIAAALDVRDKGELAARRQARKRDVLLWRITLGCAAALLLLLVGEGALFGGGFWQRGRIKLREFQQPRVDTIVAQEALARRIEELATNRLMPIEMLMILAGKDGSLKPPEIWFNLATTSSQNGIYSILVNATANNTNQVDVYARTLRGLPAIELVEIRNLNNARSDLTTFTLFVRFKPEALKPSA